MDHQVVVINVQYPVLGLSFIQDLGHPNERTLSSASGAIYRVGVVGKPKYREDRLLNDNCGDHLIRRSKLGERDEIAWFHGAAFLMVL
jgi:hypothetical protein